MRQELQHEQMHMRQQQLRQHDLTTRQGAGEMQQRFKHQQLCIQEQRAALMQSQHELGATLHGKKQYEARVHEEM